ncbi:hypothetical protein DAMA08_004300 [Martiniozyma asiatica (nom. inval.)]|nr:hypothetical protein DAMA08_004300 [Martiniozyma asiatica]
METSSFTKKWQSLRCDKENVLFIKGENEVSFEITSLYFHYVKIGDQKEANEIIKTIIKACLKCFEGPKRPQKPSPMAIWSCKFLTNISKSPYYSPIPPFNYTNKTLIYAAAFGFLQSKSTHTGYIIILNTIVDSFNSVAAGTTAHYLFKSIMDLRGISNASQVELQLLFKLLDSYNIFLEFHRVSFNNVSWQGHHNKRIPLLREFNKLINISWQSKLLFINQQHLDLLIPFIHNRILNVENMDIKVLEVAFELFLTLGKIAIEFGDVVSQMNIIKIFDDFLLFGDFPYFPTLHSQILVESDESVIQNSLMNWTFAMLDLQPDTQLTTHFQLNTKLLDFKVIFKVLDTLNILISDKKAQSLLEGVNGIYIILLNPQNFVSSYLAQLQIFFVDFIKISIEKKYEVYPENIKYVLLLNLICDNDQLKLKLESLCEVLIKNKNLMVSEFLLTLEDVDTYFENYKNVRFFEIPNEIIEISNKFVLKNQICFQLVRSNSVRQFNSMLSLLKHSKGSISSKKEIIKYFISKHPPTSSNKDLLRKFLSGPNELDHLESVTPLYPTKELNVALLYTNTFAQLKVNKMLNTDDLIIFDMFNFDNEKIRLNLSIIFNKFNFSDSFINVLTRRLAVDDPSLSKLVLKTPKLIKAVAKSPYMWNIIKGCVNSPVGELNKNCLDIFSIIILGKASNNFDKSLKDYYYELINIIYSNEDRKVHKESFWNFYALYSIDENDNLITESINGLKDALENIDNKFNDNIENKIDSHMTESNLVTKIDMKQKKIKQKNTEGIEKTNEILVGSETLKIRIIDYPEGHIPPPVKHYGNKLQDDERKDLFFTNRQRGQQYQLIVKDLFRGAFDGKEHIGKFLAKIFNDDGNWSFDELPKISKILLGNNNYDNLKGLLMLHFGSICRSRNIDKSAWDDKMSLLASECKNENIKAVAADMLKTLHSNIGKKRFNRRYRGKDKRSNNSGVSPTDKKTGNVINGEHQKFSRRKRSTLNKYQGSVTNTEK